MAASPGFRALFVLLAILALAVALAGCTSDQLSAPQGTGTPPPGAGPGTVTIKSFAFGPQQITVKQGTTVTWTNQDNVPHTVVSDAGAPDAFSSGSLIQGETFSFRFTKTGTYDYSCSIHPSMKGTVIVTS
jgi:amicyanin